MHKVFLLVGALGAAACGGIMDAEPSVAVDAGAAVSNEAAAPVMTTCVATTMTTLASGQSPYKIAIDDGYVYWVSSGAGAVRRVPKGGGTVESVSTLVTGVATDIRVDDSFVYVNPHGVWRAPKDGGSATELTVTGVDATSIAVDASKLYWVGGNSIHFVAIGGGTSMPLYPTDSSAKIGADGDGYVYFGDANGVASVDMSHMTGLTGPGPIAAITPNGGNIFFATAAAIHVIPKNSFAVKVIADSTTARHLAVDDTHVYWADSGNISRVQKNGLAREVIATYEQSPNTPSPSIAVDASCVYWSTLDSSGGTIHAMPK